MKKYNRIKVVLAEKEKTNKWLAKVLDKNPNTVSRWVQNYQQPRVETLFNIAEVLQVDVCSLLNSDPEIDQ